MPQPSLSSACTTFLFLLEEIQRLLLYFLQFFFFYSWISRNIATSLILASFAWLSTKMMSGLLASTILSHYTLKSHRTLKTCIFYRLLCGMFVQLICPFQFRLPTQLPMHIPRHTVMSPLVLTLGYRAALTLLGDLLFLPSLRTSYTYIR